MAYRPPEIVQEATKRFDAAKSHHDLFVKRYERGERAYRGILESASNAAKWRHNYSPKYAFNLIETIVANTIEMGLRFNVRPAPHAQLPLEEAIQMVTQAELVGDLLRHEHRIDGMDAKQRPLFLCDALAGRGVLKSYWNYETGPQKRQAVTLKSIHDDEGNHLLDVPVVSEQTFNEVIRDHSTAEVIDPRDWCTHESAKALQPWEPGGAQYVFNRCWYSFEQLKWMEKSGYVKDVDLLKEAELDWSDEYASREKQLWDVNRTKDLIEVLEYWKFEDGVVKRCLVGNRLVLLRDLEDSPFNHRGYPFAIVSSMPQPFSLYGVSDIELIEQLQEMVWEIGNQRLDNVELINNWITLIRDDIDDEGMEYYPGARWVVDGDPRSAIQTLQPPYQLIEATLSTEALIKGDLQNVTSAAPFAGGAQTATVDQKTATGASIVMNAAQQHMIAKKFQSQQGLVNEADMRIKNCQQFIGDRRLIHILGPDGAIHFRDIDGLQIQGDFIGELEPMGESNMRQERRAEASTLGQMLVQIAPVAAASGSPMSVKEIVLWVLKKWGIEDGERFFSAQPQAMGAMGAPGAGAPTGAPQPGGPPGPNMGITSGTAVDASKPSATGGLGMSPATMLQRALAMRGGVANTPR